MSMKTEGNIISDWLEENGDPKISRFIELSFQISEKIIKYCDENEIDKSPYLNKLTGMYNFSLRDIAKIENELKIKLI